MSARISVLDYRGLCLGAIDATYSKWEMAPNGDLENLDMLTIPISNKGTVDRIVIRAGDDVIGDSDAIGSAKGQSVTPGCTVQMYPHKLKLAMRATTRGPIMKERAQ